MALNRSPGLILNDILEINEFVLAIFETTVIQRTV